MRMRLHAIAGSFGLELTSPPPRLYGDGLIHSTFLLHTDHGPYLVQRINLSVFPDPVAVVENAAAAAVLVDGALRRVGDHDPRHRLMYRSGPRGRHWVRDEGGGVWRAVVFIGEARAADPRRRAHVVAAAHELGRFPGLLAAGSGPSPTEVLPGFHDTPARLVTLRTAVADDRFGRLAGCEREVARLLDLEELAGRCSPINQPLRLVHNDAKLDNVLVDDATGKALCVIDLDTVMPGVAVHDFGDLVRSAVTGRPEDESDLDRITVRAGTFRDLTAGYLRGSSGWLREDERSRLVDGVLQMTFEQALRFMSDHLRGDVYYPAADDEHNLRRARAQLRLVDELLVMEGELRAMVDEV